MSYKLEAINGCTKKLVFNFDDVDLSNQIQQALKSKQKESNLKGFRKGKAPLTMIEKYYGPQVKNDALYRFISEEFYKAVQEENLKAIGYPSFSNTNFEDENKKVSFEATVEIFPEFELKDYSGYEFKKEDDSVKDEDIQKTRDQYLASKSEIVEIKDDQPIANGHFAIFNFEGEKEDGEKPASMKANDFQLEIGSGQFIPGFEDGMIGLKKGDKKVIDVTFPEDYHEEGLRNAPVKFHVEVLELKEKKNPEITDELTKELGFESVKDFETKTKSQLENQKKREVQSKLQQDVLDKLIEENKFDVPSTLIAQQKEAVKSDMANNLKGQGFNDEMVNTYFEKWATDLDSKAEFQVRSGLILNKISDKYNVEVGDSDFEAKLDEIAAESGMDKEQVEAFYKSNENVKKNIMYALREEKTFEKLLGDMTVK